MWMLLVVVLVLFEVVMQTLRMMTDAVEDVPDCGCDCPRVVGE